MMSPTVLLTIVLSVMTSVISGIINGDKIFEVTLTLK